MPLLKRKRPPGAPENSTRNGVKDLRSTRSSIAIDDAETAVDDDNEDADKSSPPKFGMKEGSSHCTAPTTSTVLVASWCTAYALFSIILTLLNKVAVHTWGYPNLLLQCSFAFNFVSSIGYDYLIRTKEKKKKLKYSIFDSRIVVRWSIATLLFVFNLSSNLQAMKFAGLATLIVFRNMSSLIFAVIEVHILQRTVLSKSSVGALIVIFVGSLVYYRSLSSVLSHAGRAAHIWTLIHLACNILYDLWVRHLVKNWPLSMHGQQFYHCILSSPVLLYMATLNGELATKEEPYRKLMALPVLEKACLAATMVGGFFISTTAIRLQTLISSTSFSVVRNSNKFIIIALSFICGIESFPSTGEITGIMLSLVGSAWYGMSRKEFSTGKIKGKKN